MRIPGIIRKIDDMGRIVIPAELRQVLDLQPGDSVEIYAQQEQLWMRKFAPTCVFCDSLDELVTYSGKLLCRKCIDRMKNI